MSTHTRRNGLPVVIASESRLGRIRRAVRRAFILSSGKPILASDVIARAFPRIIRPQDWHRWSVRRALLKEAVVIGRTRIGRGRPNLWAPTYLIGSRERNS
jgi:hypothetical protein